MFDIRLADLILQMAVNESAGSSVPSLFSVNVFVAPPLYFSHIFWLLRVVVPNPFVLRCHILHLSKRQATFSRLLMPVIGGVIRARGKLISSMIPRVLAAGITPFFRSFFHS